MAGRTITRADLAAAIHADTGVARSDAGGLADQVLEEISLALVRGESVRLSSFGTFEIRDKRERMGRNPKTGQEVPIAARRVITFKSSDKMKLYINGSGPSRTPRSR